MRSLVALFLLVLARGLEAACAQVAFEPVVRIPAQGGQQPVIGPVADANGDGRDDTVVFFRDLTAFRVFQGENRPAGGAALYTLANGPSAPTRRAPVELARLDADALPDVAAAAGSALRLYGNDGGLQFSVRGEIALTAEPTQVRAGDLTGDGRADLVVIQALASQFVVLTQTAPWTFSVGAAVPVGPNPRDPELLDFDGDGRLDLVLVTSDGNVRVFWGRGDGTFDPAVTIPLPAQPGDAVSLVADDFNQDGRIDLAAGRIEGGVAVYLNDGGRAFHLAAQVAPGAGARDLDAADLNGDGFVDLVVSTHGGFLVLQGRAGGLFDPPVLHTLSELGTGQNATDALVFSIADLRGDGNPDLFASNVYNSDELAVFLNACAPPPTFTAVDPSFGPPEGNTPVVLRGTNLSGATEVLFGTLPATISLRSPDALLVRTPAASPGLVDVTVTTASGTVTLPAAYRYTQPVTVTITPPVNAVGGEPFTLVVTIAPAVTGGTVTFSEGGSIIRTVPVVNGTASLTLVSPGGVPRTITATFSGTPLYSAGSATITFAAAAGASIPTLSELALVAMAVMLAAIAAVRLR